MFSTVMPSAHLTLKEEDVVKLVLEFLHGRDLHITQLSLERETGVINGSYSDDVLFLRQLILDGQWDDVLEFVQPLESIESFDMTQFTYIILKHKYVELLCIKSEVSLVQNIDVAVEEVVKCLNELEKYCPSKEEYSNLCLLLTLPRLSDHMEYKNWNPSNARVECFKAIYPLVEKFLPVDKKTLETLVMAKNDRLIQLVIKGILYESCVEYCQHKATVTSTDTQEMQFSKLLNGTGFSDSDLSLLSWLQSIPADTFACPFEQRTLNVDVERLEKPSLEASWTEHILVTPIKPKTFPHSAMPFTRPRSADIMSRSLNPHLDGLPFGLGQHQRHLMAMSLGDITSMSKSFAGFHLTGKKSMNTSVDRLFEEADVFTSSSFGDLPSLLPSLSPRTIPANRRANLHFESPEKAKSKGCGEVISPKAPDDKPPIAPKSKSEPDTHTTKDGSPKHSKKDVEKPSVPEKGLSPLNPALTASCSELYKEYQKQKHKLQEQLALQDQKREEYLKQLMEIENQQQKVADNKLQEESLTNKENSISPPTLKTQTIRLSYNDQLKTSTPKLSGVARPIGNAAQHASPILAANNQMNSVNNNNINNIGSGASGDLSLMRTTTVKNLAPVMESTAASVTVTNLPFRAANTTGIGSLDESNRTGRLPTLQQVSPPESINTTPVPPKEVPTTQPRFPQLHQGAYGITRTLVSTSSSSHLQHYFQSG